jgi:hypothetical protein
MNKNTKINYYSLLVIAQELERITRNLKFENLPTKLQYKFARAGVRSGEKLRNMTEATKVFETGLTL